MKLEAVCCHCSKVIIKMENQKEKTNFTFLAKEVICSTKVIVEKLQELITK